MKSNETTKVKEVKGFKKGIKFFTVILAISIITSILGIISCITEGSVEVWQHVILWLTLLLEDAAILLFVRCIKNATVTVEEKENM